MDEWMNGWAGLACIMLQDVVRQFQAAATASAGAPTGSGFVVTREAYDACVRELCFGSPSSAAAVAAMRSGEQFFVAHIAGILFR